MECYILVDKEPRLVNDIEEWFRFISSPGRIVQKSFIGNSAVCTAFTGIRQSFDCGELLLYETIVFGGAHDGYTQRYSTWEDAVKGHQKVCKYVLYI